MDWKEKSKALEKELHDPKGKILPDPFGDAIIWFQILDYAKSQPQKKPIIFVTDDAKGDWWWIQSGKKWGARPELIAEMREVGVEFHMYDSSSFMEEAAKHSKNPPPEKDLADAVKEAKDSALPEREFPQMELHSASTFQGAYREIHLSEEAKNTMQGLSELEQILIISHLYRLPLNLFGPPTFGFELTEDGRFRIHCSVEKDKIRVFSIARNEFNPKLTWKDLI
jgi:hypothetical protein